MIIIGLAVMLLGFAFLGVYREIERCAPWLEDLMGPRRMMSLMIKSDRFLHAAVMLVMGGALMMLVTSSMKAPL